MTAQTAGPRVINVLSYIVMALSCMLHVHVRINRYADTILIISSDDARNGR